MKRFLFPLLILLFLAGCVAIGPQTINRGVVSYRQQENEYIAFYSEESPRVKVKIPAGFKFVGHVGEKKIITSQDIPGGSDLDIDYYVFVVANEPSRIEKLIEIRINRIQNGSLSSVMFPWMRPNFDAGSTEFIDGKYQYGTTVSSYGAGKHVDYIVNQGYILPNGFLVKGYGRRLEGNKVTFQVYYAEDLMSLKQGEYGTLKDWRESLLDAKQKEIFRAFKLRADNSFSIMPYTK